jgi:hypothetical protein
MPSSPTRSRVAAHRAQLRARGLRPVQLWLPDTRATGFAEEARRQARAVADAADARETMALLERVSVFDEAPDGAPDAAR